MLFKNDGYPLVKMEDGHRMVLRVAESKHILNTPSKQSRFFRAHAVAGILIPYWTMRSAWQNVGPAFVNDGMAAVFYCSGS